MAALGDLIRRALYPPDTVCVACGALRVDDTSLGLCDACARQMRPLEPPFCPRCGRPGWPIECLECATKPPDALDARMAAYAFDGPVRALVHALKYDCVAPVARSLAPAMLLALPDRAFEAIVPVPLHRGRQRRRGFNQAEALALALSALSDIPCVDALERGRNTRTQTSLSAERRHDNVKGAFRPRMPVQGRAILLVDDVLTTGATGNACAEALRQGGAARVVLLAAAHSLLEEV